MAFAKHLVGIFSIMFQVASYTQGFAQAETVCTTIVDEDNIPISRLLIGAFDADGAETDGKGHVCLTCIDSIYTYSSFYSQVIVACDDVGDTIRVGSLELPTVTVTKSNFTRAQYTLDAAFVQNSPTILGEADLLRSIQTLPGITGAAEGQVAPLIRGGSADQTLVVLDGVTLFSPSHAIGFLGAINTDYVSTAEVFTSNYPVRYGGRLSGIVDVTSKTVKSDEVHAKAGIGFPNTSISIDGPLGPIRYLVSARASFPSLFLFGTTESRIAQGDGFVKLEMPFKGDRMLSYRGYANRDRWSYVVKAGLKGDNSFNKSRNTLSWGNNIHSVNFTQPLGSAAVSLRGSVSSYTSGGQDVLRDSTGVSRNSLPGASRAAYELAGELEDFNLLGGTVTAALRGELSVSKLAALVENDNSSVGRNLNNISGALGLNYTYPLSSVVAIRAGARLFFIQENRTDGGNGSMFGTYLEPRTGIFASLGKLEVGFNYDRMTQDVHVLSLGGDDSFYQIFLPPSRAYRAATSSQFSFVVDKPLNKAQLEWSAQIYYKTMDNLIYTPDGSRTAPDLRTINSRIEVQEGRAYGVEASAQYRLTRFGKFLVSYTLSRSERRAAVSQDKAWSKFRWDRLHNLSVSHSVVIGPNWIVNSSFTFQSGNRYSLPSYSVANGYLTNIPIPVYTSRYNAIGPVHHRLDVSAVRTWLGKRRQQKLIFSVYNIYARPNPFSVYHTYEFSPPPGIDPIFGVDFSPAIRTVAPLRFIPGVQYQVTL